MNFYACCHFYLNSTNMTEPKTRLTLDEVALIQSLFTKADTNHDNSLSLTEFLDGISGTLVLDIFFQ